MSDNDLSKEIDNTPDLESEVFDIEAEEEFEVISLSFRQWIYIASSTFISFLIFIVILFPLEDVVRFIVYKNLKGIEFQELNINALGKDKLKYLVIRTKGLEVRSKNVESDLSWLSLMGKSAKGTLKVFDVDVISSVLAFKIKKVKLKIKLGPLQENSKKKLSGFVKLNINQAVVEKAGPLPLEPGLLKISKARIHMVFSNGNVAFREFEIDSNVFRIEIKNGRLGLAADFANATLRGKLCLSPTKQLRENERFISIRSLYELAGGNLLGRFCRDLEGTLGKPSIKMKTPEITTESSESPQDGILKKKINPININKPAMPDELKKRG